MARGAGRDAPPRFNLAVRGGSSDDEGPHPQSEGLDLGELLQDSELAWAGECARWRRCAPEDICVAAGVPDLMGTAAAAPGLDPAALARALAIAPAALLLGVKPGDLPKELASGERAAGPVPTQHHPEVAPHPRGPARGVAPPQQEESRPPISSVAPSRQVDPLEASCDVGSGSDDEDLDALLGSAPDKAVMGSSTPLARTESQSALGKGGDSDDDADLDALLNS